MWLVAETSAFLRITMTTARKTWKHKNMSIAFNSEKLASRVSGWNLASLMIDVSVSGDLWREGCKCRGANMYTMEAACCADWERWKRHGVQAHLGTGCSDSDCSWTHNEPQTCLWLEIVLLCWCVNIDAEAMSHGNNVNDSPFHLVCVQTEQRWCHKNRLRRPSYIWTTSDEVETNKVVKGNVTTFLPGVCLIPGRMNHTVMLAPTNDGTVYDCLDRHQSCGITLFSESMTPQAAFKPH